MLKEDFGKYIKVTRIIMCVGFVGNNLITISDPNRKKRKNIVINNWEHPNLGKIV